MKEILYVLLDNFADHEMPFLAQGVTADEAGLKQNPKYVNKIVAPTMEPVKSIGDLECCPTIPLILCQRIMQHWCL